MSDIARFLGFAFANADLLIEVDGGGKIVFATGAVGDFVKDTKTPLVGQFAARLFQPSEGAKFATLTHALAAGGRAGPFKLKLASGAEVALAMFRLSQNGGNVSCTLATPGTRVAAGGGDPKTGLSEREGFLAAAAGIASGDNELALVNVPALRDASARMSPAESEKLYRRIGESIRQVGPKAAARLSDASFGVIAQAAGGANKLGQSIRKALQEGGVDAEGIEETLVSLKSNSLSADQQVLAMRYVLDCFTAQGKDPNTPRDLTVAFDTLMNATQDRALALTQAVADGSFSFAYQPVVDLKTRTVTHYEALARFSEDANTGEIIGFAEALGIADAFDLAVAIKVIAYVAGPQSGKTCVAFNVSGHTLASSAAFGMLAGLLARNRNLAPRLLVEITETAEISDIPAANKAIQAMREMGFQVGLDDFGAGAASLQYLHGFTLDFVKVDGALVKKLGASKREDVLLHGIVNLCRELGIRTIAECIEDEALLKRARDIGFDLGQGHHLGRPAALPAPPPADKTVAMRAKRQGERVSWG
jgi:EAL domain-containing protein (putative c-di-GMP-specific phosphodiesterase class I)